MTCLPCFPSRPGLNSHLSFNFVFPALLSLSHWLRLACLPQQRSLSVDCGTCTHPCIDIFAQGPDMQHFPQSRATIPLPAVVAGFSLHFRGLAVVAAVAIYALLHITLLTLLMSPFSLPLWSPECALPVAILTRSNVINPAHNAIGREHTDMPWR